MVSDTWFTNSPRRAPCGAVTCQRRRWRSASRAAGIALGVAALLSNTAAKAQGNAAPLCASSPEYAALDFWIGTWDVFVNGGRAGQNTIAKVLDGCAVTELWRPSGGGEGRSFFYYSPGAKSWKQVWVTARALEPGGTKEKRLVTRLPDGSVVFQGEIALATGGTYLDRTTLTPTGADEVRQLIEYSTDGGQTWRPSFDGRYVRRK